MREDPEILFRQAGRCRLAAAHAERPDRKRLLRLAIQYEAQALGVPLCLPRRALARRQFAAVQELRA